MEKLDLRKEFAPLYKASAKAPALVEAPAMNFIMIDGAGDPNLLPAFQQAVETLYGLSYTLKFSMKMGKGRDWSVMGLEGLWWADAPDQAAAFRSGAKDRWRWTLMIAQPDFITPADVEEARKQLRERRNPAAIDLARLERLEEGLAAQILHVGPYDQEGPTVQRLHDFVREQGCVFAGKHHEVYLNDPRRTKPERWKTIIRQPVRKA